MTGGRCTTLTFERDIAAPAGTVWQVWTAPKARALWAAPSPDITVEVMESDSRPGGREVSYCRADGTPEVRCEVNWLVMRAPHLSVNSEVIASNGQTDCATLITTRIEDQGDKSRLSVTVQLSSLAADMEAGYRFGYGGGLDNLTSIAARTMVITRTIRAPVAKLWAAWMNPETLPQWWGPDGFSCRTSRINLGQGGEWLFDMIGPDGTVFPNHHRYGTVVEGARIEYSLHAGEGGPVHADAWVHFEEQDGITTVTLGMVMSSQEAHDGAKAFGAEALGLQTLGKLARFIGAE